MVDGSSKPFHSAPVQVLAWTRQATLRMTCPMLDGRPSFTTISQAGRQFAKYQLSCTASSALGRNEKAFARRHLRERAVAATLHTCVQVIFGLNEVTPKLPADLVPQCYIGRIYKEIRLYASKIIDFERFLIPAFVLQKYNSITQFIIRQ